MMNSAAETGRDKNDKSVSGRMSYLRLRTVCTFAFTAQVHINDVRGMMLNVAGSSSSSSSSYIGVLRQLAHLSNVRLQHIVLYFSHPPYTGCSNKATPYTSRTMTRRWQKLSENKI